MIGTDPIGKIIGMLKHQISSDECGLMAKCHLLFQLLKWECWIQFLPSLIDTQGITVDDSGIATLFKNLFQYIRCGEEVTGI